MKHTSYEEKSEDLEKKSTQETASVKESEDKTQELSQKEQAENEVKEKAAEGEKRAKDEVEERSRSQVLIDAMKSMGGMAAVIGIALLAMVGVEDDKEQEHNKDESKDLNTANNKEYRKGANTQELDPNSKKLNVQGEDLNSPEQKNKVSELNLEEVKKAASGAKNAGTTKGSEVNGNESVTLAHVGKENSPDLNEIF